MNKVFLKGNVGQDPRITQFEGGGKVAQFTLATTKRGFTTREGREIQDETQWHNIVVRRTGLAGVCEQFVKKGTPLLIVGEIQTRNQRRRNGIVGFKAGTGPGPGSVHARWRLSTFNGRFAVICR